MREIVLDTETTGLEAKGGDRLIEIGCVELINRFPSGVEFHRFLNPETKEVHADAFRIHGISTEFLKDKPVFKTEVDTFLDFIGDAPLIIHNATFDIGFLNMEFERLNKPSLDMGRVIDTLQLARRKFPGAPASLDALCKRFNIDNTQRTKHGAIVDSLLLAQVYVELLGERQATLSLAVEAPTRGAQSGAPMQVGDRPRQRVTPLPPRLSEEQMAAHAAFVETLGPSAIWKRA
jgi:DNA polymerase-3 subunit epsilon